MSTFVKTMAVLFLVAAATTSVGAQMPPLGMGVDSSLRLEFLVGSQEIREARPVFDTFDRFKFDYSPRFPLLSGTVELSPIPWASGRMAGSVSVLEGSTDTYRSGNGLQGPGATWNSKPYFTSWEAAGLLHLWSGGGYRFSVTSGFRKRNWLYHSEATGVTDPSAPSRELFVSQIPFLGLQTSMSFPWWKASFEVLGSPFMTKTANVSLVRGAQSVQYNMKANRGGFLEFQMAGTVGVTQNVRCGLSGRFSYEELFGTLDWSSSPSIGPQPSIEAQSNEVTGVVGFDVTVVF